jgi:hypothetical protein
MLWDDLCGREVAHFMGLYAYGFCVVLSIADLIHAAMRRMLQMSLDEEDCTIRDHRWKATIMIAEEKISEACPSVS